MKFSLIICTFMRPQSLLRLLNSVCEQTLYPNEILIIDGSTNNETNTILKEKSFKNVTYFKVLDSERGLTKQRNIGINLVAETSEIICFLDDDIVLTPNYFETLISTYSTNQDALAVGGYIINDTKWEKICGSKNPNYFYFDSWQRKEPYRFKIRKAFGLEPDANPGFLPTFAHGRPLEFLPPSGKIYEVEQLMGGASSYRKMIFDRLSFSTYFIGYGLYEDTDFALRLAKEGKLYVNTKAQLYHHHNDSGRPNQFNYGKMVIRNGWYTWRVKYPNPNIKARIKWNATAFLLTLIRIINTINTNQKIATFSEGMGRVIGWFSLLFNKPKIQG
jgi:GT2 family glycosyltransferase